MGVKTERNFITTNAVSNIMSVPRNPPLKYVDTSKGAQHLVEVKHNDYWKLGLYLACVSIINDIRPLNSHSFGVRLKLLGQISNSHSRPPPPPKSHSF